MSDELSAEREMERLQSMHETVERLRSQLRTIPLETVQGETEAGPRSPELPDTAKPGSV